MTPPIDDHTLNACLARVKGQSVYPSQEILRKITDLTAFREYFADRTVLKMNAGDCINWIGVKHNFGYGMIRFMGWTIYAHRASYIMANGIIPEGMELDHLCSNPSCVNPAHLEAVTHKENLARGMSPSAVCGRKEYCIRGHKLAGENLIKAGKGKRKRLCRECNRIKCKEKYDKKRAFALAVQAMEQSQKETT